MRRLMGRSRFELVIVVFVMGCITTLVGQQQPPRQGAGRLQLEPLGAKNEAVFPYFEGWTNNSDGTASILIGYYNRNSEQTLDVPIGPNNRIEPGGPDRGQPTHFLPRRQYGVFSITVPKDSTQKFTWTLTANNLTNAVTVWLNPQYFVEPYRNVANGNTPPKIKFIDAGPVIQGPPVPVAQTLQAAVDQPVPLTLWAADVPATYDAVTNRFMTPEEVAARQAKEASEGGGRGGRGGTGATGATGAAGGRGGGSDPGAVAIVNGQVINMSGGGRGGAAAALAAGRGGASGPPGDVNINWSKYRGPGDVKFAEARVPVRLKGNFSTFQEAKTTATFSAPGEYWLRAVANDASGDGGGGDQCCWTTVHVKVIVK
jgi:hypothetical protein